MKVIPDGDGGLDALLEHYDILRLNGPAVKGEIYELGKPTGNYVTLSAPGNIRGASVLKPDRENRKDCDVVLAASLTPEDFIRQLLKKGSITLKNGGYRITFYQEGYYPHKDRIPEGMQVQESWYHENGKG
jgi:hypothetical protein